MNNIITAEMMDRLSYDIVKSPKMLESNSLKRVNDLEKLTVTTNLTSLTEVCHLVQENLRILANIEAEDNCVPYKIAERRIKDALSYVTLSDNQFTQEKPVKKALVRVLNYHSISKVLEAIFLSLYSKTSELCIIFDRPRKRFIEFLFFELLKYKKDSQENISQDEDIGLEQPSYSSMFVLSSSDIDAAVFNLTKSFEDPNCELTVKTVYVQESCYVRFSNKLESQLRPYSSELMRDEVFVERYDAAQEKLKTLKASVIKPTAEKGKMFQLVCKEFDLKYFPDFAPVVVIKVIRTVKEAISLAKLEKCYATTIWTQNFSIAYEIVNSLNIEYFFINCFGVESKIWRTINMFLDISGFEKTFEKLGNSGVSIENNYHFEYFISGGICKRIVFPFGVTFAN